MDREMIERPERIITRALLANTQLKGVGTKTAAGILSALNEAGCVVEQGWQPIESFSGDSDTPVLVGAAGFTAEDAFIWKDGTPRGISKSGQVTQLHWATHFRPLPEPPAILTAAQGDGTDG